MKSFSVFSIIALASLSMLTTMSGCSSSQKIPSVDNVQTIETTKIEQVIATDYENALLKAGFAIGLTEVAVTTEDWQRIIDQWEESINLLKSVSSESDTYLNSQTKIEEYSKKLKEAKDKLLDETMKVQMGKIDAESTGKNQPQQENIESFPNQAVSNNSLESYVTKVLDEVINKGYSFPIYWCEKNKQFASSLFSPYNYTILDILPSKDGGGLARIRIQSTNKGGIPIMKVWRFSFDKENGDYCISNIF